jgi:hypothetical protein
MIVFGIVGILSINGLRKGDYNMSLEDSVILGLQADPSISDETQEDVNESSLWISDQKDLLESVSDKYISRYEIDFLMGNVSDSNGIYWNDVLKEIIGVYHLNTLKFFLEDESTSDKIIEIKKLLRFLKVDLQTALLVDSFPLYRDEIKNYLKKYDAPRYMIFAINTIDKEDLENFKLYCSKLKH